MAYDLQLAAGIRSYLHGIAGLTIEEKKMFRGLTFMVNGKMCVCVSGENLMCRFDPALQEELSVKPGFTNMIMKGSVYKGYCYVSPEGFKTKNNFEFWLQLCVAYNEKAVASKKAAAEKSKKAKS